MSAGRSKATSAGPAPGRSRARRWLRRGVIAAAALLCVMLTIRISLLVLLPTVIGRTARAMGVDCTYDRMKLSVLGTNATLWGVSVRSRDGKEELLRAEYVNANLSTLRLLGLGLLVWRLEADDVVMTLERRADGSIPLLTHLTSAMGAKTAGAKPAKPGAARPADFDSPMELKALRLHGVTVRVRDESVSPPFEETVRLDLRVTDIGRKGAPALVELVVGSDGLFSAARFEGEANAAGPALDAAFRFSLRGIHADRAGAYLAAAGLAADDRNIDMAGRGSLSLRASKTRAGALEGSASLTDVAVRAASEPVAGLAKVDATIASLSPSEVHLSDVRIEHGSIRAVRGEDGQFRLAAFTTGGARSAAAPTAPPPAAPPVTPAATPGTPLRWRVDRLAVSSLAASWLDRAVSPANTLTLELAELNATELSNHGPPEAESVFNARLAAPGLVGSITVDGRAAPFAPEPRAVATVDIGSIRPDALTPYLRALGIESTLDGASMRFAVTASLEPGAEPDAPRRGGLVLERIVVRDGEESVAEIGPVTVNGLAVGATGELEIGSLEGSGPVFGVRRLRNGLVEIPGLRVGGPVPARPAAVAAASPAALGGAPAASPLVMPSIRIGRLDWSGVKVGFEDLALPGGAPMELSDAGIEIENLVLGPGAGGPGSLRVWARAPGLLERFEVAGNLNSGNNAVSLEAHVEGEGASLARLGPYLEALSIRPTLEDGRLSARLSAGIAPTERGAWVSLAVSDTALRQGDEVLVGVARAGVDRVDLEPGRVAAGTVQVTGLEFGASRDAAGAIHAAGLTLLPGVPSPSAGPPPDPLAMLAAMGDVSVEGVRVEGLKLRWSDQAAKQPVATAATVDATLGALALNRPDAAPAALDVRLTAEGIAEQVQVAGTLRAGGEGVAVEANVSARGLSADTVAAYLPPGMESGLRDGRLSLSASLALTPAEGGGFGAAVAVRDLDYREAGAESALARVGSFVLEVDRLDPATGDVVVRRIAGDGIAAAATRRPDGAIEVLGVAVAAAPPGAPETVEPPPADQEADVAALVQGSRGAPPLLAIEGVDLRIERVAFTDAARPGSAPVAITDMRIRTTAPIRLLGPTPEANPPGRVEIVGSLEPLIGEYRIEAEAAPFAAQPVFEASIAASGIDGSAITRVAPELAELIDGSSLTDGRFAMRIVGDANVRRRAGGQIDLSRGFEANFTVEGTEFRSGESGPVLLAVKTVRAEQVKVEPATGNVIARTAEAEGITGNAWRDETGVHVLGLIIKPLSMTEPTEPTEPSPSEPAADGVFAMPATPPADAPAVDLGAAQDTGASAAAGPEIRIDRLSASGLDFRFEDRAVSPPVTVPIDSLEAEVRGLSSQLLARDRPVRFNVTVGAGTVTLPKRVRGGALTGALSDMMRGDDVPVAPEMEEREFFSQITARGTMAFYPLPRGRAIVSVSGMELAALRGLAQAAGASVGGGVFDARVDLRAREDGAVAVRTRLVVTDLRYAEPPSGPVERYMSLPVPIDLAINAVEAPDGSITLPVDVTLDQRGLTTGKLVGAIAGAAGQVVATAVASAPVKLVGGFASLVVDVKGEQTWVEEEPIALEYEPGVSALPADAMGRLLEAIARARVSKRVQVSIEHQLGAADEALTARRANPTMPDASALAEDLRRRRAGLIARREELLAPASAWAMGVPGGADAVGRLVRLQEELADIEDSMDRLYGLQRPGAEAQANRRSRAAAIDLIDARMGAVRQTVQRLGGSGVSRIAVGGSKVEPAGAERSRLVVRVRQRK